MFLQVLYFHSIRLAEFYTKKHIRQLLLFSFLESYQHYKGVSNLTFDTPL